MKDIFIVGAARTPIGSFGGSLASVSAPQLGATAIRAALERAGVSADRVGEVTMGNVLGAGVGQAPARQASIYAGIPNSVPCMTINKVCGSGLKSAMLVAQSIALGEVDVAVAGGMENMSAVPYALLKARWGQRMGDGTLTDLMVHDGLWDVYNNFHMGNAGELCAREMDFSREAQDQFAAESYRRALAAQAEGRFDAEIAAVAVPQRKGDPTIVSIDEEPGRGDPSKFGKLRPAFDKAGTITAANASTINDGAAALVLASGDAVKAHGLTPLARWVGSATHAQAPEWFTTAPVKAMQNALTKTSLSTKDVGLYEINEAFSVVTMAAMRELGLDHSSVNVNGGAVALGHPIGCSGARLIVTLLHAMQQRDVERGMASLCIGGGEAVAAIIERV